MSLGRRELFPPDRGLQLRIALSIAVNGVLLLALTAACVVLVAGDTEFLTLVAFAALFVIVGAVAGARGSEPEDPDAREPSQGDTETVAGIVDRLCLIGDIAPAPETRIERSLAPLTWTTDAPFRPPHVHVTTGMVDLLPPKELEAALAHELTHIANRDAFVTTVLSAPGIYFFRGLGAIFREKDLEATVSAVVLGFLLMPVALVFSITGRFVSRQREFAADRGAALLTGDPNALASALRRITGTLEQIPKKDLRAVGTHNPLNLLPTRERRWLGRLWATHPKLNKRLAHLDELERVRHVPGAAVEL